MSIVVKLSFPDASLFPNRKNGRSYKGTINPKTKARDDAFYATKEKAGDWKDPGGHIPLSIVFVQPTGHHRDLDNIFAAAKPLLDGMAQALGVDDKRFRPILIDCQGVGKPGAMIVAVGVQIVALQEVA